MRTIKSIWTKPKGFFFDGLEECASHSILRALKFAGHCDIVTDSLGFDWLKSLALPIDYSRVSLALNDLESDGHVWAEGKLFTYALQQSPFIHTDLDVMIARDWPERIKRSDIVCERHYFMQHNLSGLSLSDSWQDAAFRQDGRSFACGVWGGNDIDTLTWAAKAGLDFINRNRKRLASMNGLFGSLVAEEWGAMREVDWMEVSALLPATPQGNIWAKISKNFNHQVGKFKRSPEGLAYNIERLEQLQPGQSSRCRDVRKAFASAGAPA